MNDFLKVMALNHDRFEPACLSARLLYFLLYYSCRKLAHSPIRNAERNA